MLRKALLTTAFCLATTASQAATLGFELTISNLLDGNGSTTNVPLMTLENTSSSALLTRFTMTIGDTGFNYDAIYFFNPSPGGTMTLIAGDMDSADAGGNAARVDTGIIDFTSFDPGETADWRVDIDVDTSDTLEDYRTVLFNNGAATPNAAFSATFDTGAVLTVVATDLPATQTSYTFAAVQPIPVPAALPMLMAGVGGLAFLRRRKT